MTYKTIIKSMIETEAALKISEIVEHEAGYERVFYCDTESTKLNTRSDYGIAFDVVGTIVVGTTSGTFVQACAHGYIDILGGVHVCTLRMNDHLVWGSGGLECEHNIDEFF